MKLRILPGDVIEQSQTLDDDSIDVVITDPPYNIGMDEWDKWKSNTEYGHWCSCWGKEMLRVLKPGGTIFSFGAARTYHWLACALEQSGFTTIDMIEWVYWGTMPRKQRLKSCHEPIYVGSKGKFDGFNIDDIRISLDKKLKNITCPNIPEGKHPGRSGYDGSKKVKKYNKSLDSKPYQMSEDGRHPFNIITPTMVDVVYPINVLDVKKPRGAESLSGHPTQKPVSLMSWLIRSVTSPGDTVLDCFGGTGTTGEAALLLDRNVVLIERDPVYLDIIKQRLTFFGI